MNKMYLLLLIVLILQSCNNSGQGGAVNDGNKIMLKDSSSKDTGKTNYPALDTSKMKDRVDIQQRDTFKHTK